MIAIAVIGDSNLIETTAVMIAGMTDMITDMTTITTIALVTTPKYIYLQIGSAISVCSIQNTTHHHQISNIRTFFVMSLAIAIAVPIPYSIKTATMIAISTYL